MAPDANEINTSMVMGYGNKDTQLSSDSGLESSDSEVEISSESDLAMSEDVTSSSSSEDESESSESSFEQTEGQYEELVEDPREGSGEFAQARPQLQEHFSEDLLFASTGSNSNPQQRQRHPNRTHSFSTATTVPTSTTNRHLQSPSQSGEALDKLDVATPRPERRVKPPFEASENHEDDTRRNQGSYREKVHSVVSDPITPAKSEEIETSSYTKSQSRPSSINSLQKQPTSSRSVKSRTNSESKPSSIKSLQKQPTSSRSVKSGTNSESKPSSINSLEKQPTSSRSIKIPAVHKNKQDGDDDYIKRKIQQECDRRSRSLSRSEKSGSSSGRNHSNSKHRNRKRANRSRSNSKHGRHQENQSAEQQFVGGENSLHESSLSSHSNGNHAERPILVNPDPGRLSTILHTSTPSNQLTGSTSKSANSKHSNYNGAKRVSWKSDPKASFSDWTLHVVYRDSNNKRQTDVYHVHRNVVGFGNRKSNFLLRDIMKNELQEFLDIDTNNKTEVELQELIKSGKSKKSRKDKKTTIITRLKLPSESQARSVPMVLDFMYYTNETKQRMSADRSCNVFKVAESLDIQALQMAIGEFYMKSLSLRNLGEFLSAAAKVKAVKLLTICKAKIGQMITVKPELSAMVPPKFMAEILSISSRQLIQARKKDPQKYTVELIVSQSQYWSKAACICAAKNESIMTQKLFQKLTSEESLPFIDVSATPRLLSMESTFLDGRKNGRMQLTSLQRRCVESIGENFDAFQECFDTHQEIAESLKHLPSNILSEILMKLMTRP